MQTVHLHCKVDLVNLDHLINFGDIHCHMISYTALVSGMDTCEKPLAVKPTLQDLAIIPLQESQWYMLGQALGLQESLLDSIQMGSSNPIRRKREMFKSWLEVKSDSVSWQTLLSALRAIGAADVAERVQNEYGISDSEEELPDKNEEDAGFEEVCNPVHWASVLQGSVLGVAWVYRGFLEPIPNFVAILHLRIAVGMPIFYDNILSLKVYSDILRINPYSLSIGAHEHS